jgi:hypothetical protein
MKVENFIAPSFFTTKIKELNEKFELILITVASNYPDMRKNPNSTTNAKTISYTEGIAKMKELQSEYFLFKNDLLKESENLSKYGKEIDDKINEMEEKNKTIQKKLDSIKASGDSATGLLDDTQLTRNQIFVGNILLFLLLIGGGYVFYKKTNNTE